MSDTMVRSVGVVVTNGVAKFHTSSETGEKAGFNKVAVPMPGNGKPWAGRFIFLALPKPMSKLDAAKHMLASFGQAPSTDVEEFITCLTSVVVGKQTTVKAKKTPKAERVTVKVEKTLSDADAKKALESKRDAIMRLREKANNKLKEAVVA